jgi:hypothetical protein
VYTSRTAGLLLSLSLVQACGDSGEPLPSVHGQAWAEGCILPLPPPPPPPAGLELAVITRGSDPVHCLPPDVRREGLFVDVELSPGGRPLSVAAVQHLCVVIGPDGKVQPPFDLTPATEACILADLRSWRFARGNPCHRHGTSIQLMEERGGTSDSAALHVSGSCAG